MLTKHRSTISLDEDVYRYLKQISPDKGMMSGLVNELVRQHQASDTLTTRLHRLIDRLEYRLNTAGSVVPAGAA